MGTTYQPLFPYFAHLKSRAALQNGHAADSTPTQPAGAFRVIADSYVKDDSGTGVVHQAPAFGEDDFRICIESSGLTTGCCMLIPTTQCYLHHSDAPAQVSLHRERILRHLPVPLHR